MTLSIRQDSSAADPVDVSVSGSPRRSADGEEAQDSPVLPGAASVRWASLFAIVAMIALFTTLALARYPRVLGVSSADIAFEPETIALRAPIARTVAARLRVGYPLALEIPGDSARAKSTRAASTRGACRIEGRIAAMPEVVGVAPSFGPAIHRLRIAVDPPQRGRCRSLSDEHFEARLDLGSDSYASMFAAALFRR